METLLFYEKAAFFGLIIANTIGGIRLVLEFVYPTPSCGELDERPKILRLNYLYFGMMLLFITATLIVVLSFLTTPQSLEQVQRKWIIALNSICPCTFLFVYNQLL